MHQTITAFVAGQWSVPEASLNVEVLPLQGGLESAVARARITHAHGHASIPGSIVVKQLERGLEREADVYGWLWRQFDTPPAVRVLGRERRGETTLLFLEDAGPAAPWPWADVEVAAGVCRALAQLHDSAAAPAAPAWDYERELLESAQLTLDVAAAAKDRAGRRFWRRLGDLRRVVAALADLRAELLGGGTRLIHGDVHPGNVCVRLERPDAAPVLIDWGRARLGSPLEDIASWLHSLGCWEPEARRRHDTLMRAYLDARAVPRRFDSALRREYWLASASNGLSGAIRYHLAVLIDPVSNGRMRHDSQIALAAWQRVVRRASALVA
jgi:hypothetical protein